MVDIRAEEILANSEFIVERVAVRPLRVVVLMVVLLSVVLLMVVALRTATLLTSKLHILRGLAVILTSPEPTNPAARVMSLDRLMIPTPLNAETASVLEACIVKSSTADILGSIPRPIRLEKVPVSIKIEEVKSCWKVETVEKDPV
jgi:hypothetical protein